MSFRSSPGGFSIKAYCSRAAASSLLSIHSQRFQHQSKPTRLKARIRPENTIETVEQSLIRMFRLGPAVSFSGSPTVSPTTAALCCSLPLPPWCPASIYFLALSQAPPALDINTAMAKPDTETPPSIPTTPTGPSSRPVTMGTITATRAGAIISCSAPLVHSATHLAYSGSA